jgi:hypothetical protein
MALWTVSIASFSSISPNTPPNGEHPNPSDEIFKLVLPSVLYSILSELKFWTTEQHKGVHELDRISLTSGPEESLVEHIQKDSVAHSV